MRKIKVKLYAHENDSYVELYKVISGDTKVEYFGRHTNSFGDDGVWYFVSDPLGYCELDHECSNEYVFIVCDKKGKELFHDSNGKPRNPFPTLERKAKIEWEKITGKYPCKKKGLNGWLLSFLTKEISETKLKNEPCHESNWLHWYDKTTKEIVGKFSHLGVNYCIYKIICVHKYCECQWFEFYSGFEKMDENTGYVHYHGAYFDESRHGPNYSRNMAEELVETALKEVYPNRFSLSFLNKTEHADYEQRLNYRQASERLLNGNFDRAFVNEIIEKEKVSKTFYDDFLALKKDHPNAIMDFSFKY